MFKEVDFKEIKARGWIAEFLQTQADGLTGEMGNIGEPFCLETWEAPEKERNAEEVFLGGINSLDDSWVPFEQNGYWIDGAIRAGRLIDNQKLIDLATKKMYPSVVHALKAGYFGPSYLKDGLRWPFAVYFRALIAEYTASGNKDILEALKKHFLRAPMTESYKRKDLRIISVRNCADIETALWLYGQTGDERFLKMSENSYAVFNEIFSDDSCADENSEMLDVTVKGMLKNRKVQRNHGVTYCEVCKLAAILYYYTGKELYKTAAIRAFDKLYRDQMLIDGVCSSTEYLNGNGDSHAMHETCDISDMTWALGYLYMITGDAKYGDWVENAIFNAGLGCVDSDFKGQQYFSCPNQVIADDTSNHVSFFRGQDWNSYAPKKFLACCAGNVHRFMPNYVYRAFMKDGDILSAFVYAPCKLTTTLGGKRVTVEENTRYPFENRVEFIVKTANCAAFTLILRKPEWAESTTVTLNGELLEVPFEKNICRLERTFQDGDRVAIAFTDTIRLIKNAGGISVKKGALLYALPVKERVVINGLRELNNPDFPHYSLYPESKWNYALSPSAEFAFENGEVGEKPWQKAQNGLKIHATMRELKNWKLKTVNSFWRRVKPRVKLERVYQKVTFTPKVGKVNQAKLGKEEKITLVPYATTRLRIAIFPLIEN